MHELLNNGNRAVFVGSDAGTRICIEARRPEQRCGGNGLRRFACGFKHKSSSLAWVRGVTILILNSVIAELM